MYVRREIRALTSADLEATMDAMFTLWGTSDADGQDLYGEEYLSSKYLTEMHYFNAAWKDGDHIHEGNGFLLQHVKMSNLFEKAIQAVNPSVSLPYWDFTIEKENNMPVMHSPIFSDDMFGNFTWPEHLTSGYTYASDLVVDGRISSGRWKDLKAEKVDTEKFASLASGYGYLRAPWNMNPSPYVSRFTSDYQIGISLPSCSSHYGILQSNSMTSMFYNIANSPHATTHSLIGGIYGCDLLKPMLDAGLLLDDTSRLSLCSRWIFYSKEFYRFNQLVPGQNCEVTEDVQSSTCPFTCVEANRDNLLSNIKSKLSGVVPEDIDDDGWDAWVDFVCTDGASIFAGDHLESASPADPSFWVIHPTLERLLHAKLLAGGFADETWATEAIDACDKYTCYSPFDDESAGTSDYYDECCDGHFENSALLDHTTGERCSSFGVTNAQMLQDTDPRSSTEYVVSYVYDSFSWEHCSDDFSTLLDKLYSISDSGTGEPSLSPTKKPTALPTASPTRPNSPTYSPSHTDEPTMRPTHRPTLAPVQGTSFCS